MKYNGVVTLLGVVAALVFCMAPAQAAIVLTDGTAQVSIDEASDAGIYQFNIDGVEQLYQEWYWFRQRPTFAGSGGVLVDNVPLNSLPASIVNQTANSVTIRFTKAATDNRGGPLQIDLTLTLTSISQQEATLDKQITYTNMGTATQEFHLFAYSDYDLNGSANDQSVVFTPAATYTQIDLGSGGSTTLISIGIPNPSRHEAGIVPTLLNNIDNTPLYNLACLGAGACASSDAGPGNVSFAFQWDYLGVGVGQSRDAGQGNNIATIPEPATMLLTGIGLIGAGIIRRRVAKKA